MNPLDDQHITNDDSHPQVALGSADMEALSALINADYRIEQLPSDLRERASQVAAVLGLLAATPIAEIDLAAGRESLIGRTRDLLCAAQAASASVIADIQSAHQSRGWVHEDDSMLAAADRDALEALIGAGFDSSRVSHGVRDRARHHARILSLLNIQQAFSETDRNDRVERTLSFVQGKIENRETGMRIPPATPVTTARPAQAWRLSDLVSVAAVLAIGTGVLWPMFASSRERAQQTACLANFSALKTAFGQYGGDNTGSLPMATASLAGNVWWNIGKPAESNAANTFYLSRSGYATLDQITCPGSCMCLTGKPTAGQVDFSCMNEVSYSMQNLFANCRPAWSGGDRTVILADRSPVTLANMNKTAADPTSNSPNHGARGQNVLWNDGSATWAPSPILSSGDNIWLPQPLEFKVISMELVRDSAGNPVVLLKGIEQPGCEKDSFLGP